jgi:Tfp pilus assembly protein PilO
MKICGSYNDIAQMLTNIGSLNRIVTAINLQLTLPQGCPAGPPGKQVLSTSFEIQTYVVRTAPKKGAAKKPAPASGGATNAPPPPTAAPQATPGAGNGRGKAPGGAE